MMDNKKNPMIIYRIIIGIIVTIVILSVIGLARNDMLEGISKRKELEQRFERYIAIIESELEQMEIDENKKITLEDINNQLNKNIDYNYFTIYGMHINTGKNFLEWSYSRRGHSIDETKENMEIIYSMIANNSVFMRTNFVIVSVRDKDEEFCFRIFTDGHSINIVNGESSDYVFSQLYK